MIPGVEAKAVAGDPKFKKVPVVTGRFALLEKQDIREGSDKGHRPEREAQPPCDMKETEQDQSWSLASTKSWSSIVYPTPYSGRFAN